MPRVSLTAEKREALRDFIKSRCADPPKCKEIWYLIPVEWWHKLNRFLECDQEELEDEDNVILDPIDVSVLTEPSGRLKNFLNEEIDYKLVPEEVWNKCVECFGIEAGSVPLARNVIMVHDMPHVEVYLKTFSVVVNRDNEEEEDQLPGEDEEEGEEEGGEEEEEEGGEKKAADAGVSNNALVVSKKNKKKIRRGSAKKRQKLSEYESTEISFSKNDTIEFLKQKIVEVLGLTEDHGNLRIWDYGIPEMCSLLDEPSNTIDKTSLIDDQYVVVDVRRKDGTWPQRVPGNSELASRSGSFSASGSVGFNHHSASYSGMGRKTSYTASGINSFNAEVSSGFGSNSDLPNGLSGAASNADDSHGGSSAPYSSLGRAVNERSSGSGSLWDSGIGSPYGSSTGMGGGRIVRGTCGLNNLGNTCFMNSSLQCLSNTPPLTEYFLDGTYAKEINRTNPLGMKGEVADEYGDLVKELWSGCHSSIAPRNFKYKLGIFAPQFSGYSQHDSQELLAFLLDGLHEDLNRIKNKPYVEMKDSDGRPDAVVANETWENHLKRNDSIIVDLFQGQFKSKLICPDCEKVSVTFDPFMYLSLPLPSKEERSFEVTVEFSDRTKSPKKFKLTVQKTGSVQKLLEALQEASGIDTKHLLIANVCHGRFYSIYTSPMSVRLEKIEDRDVLIAYELLVPVPPELARSHISSFGRPTSYMRSSLYSSDEDMSDANSDQENGTADKKSDGFVVVYIMHRSLGESTGASNSYHHGYTSTYSANGKLFGRPFVICVKKHITYSEFHDQVYGYMQRYLNDSNEMYNLGSTEDLMDTDEKSPFVPMGSDEADVQPDEEDMDISKAIDEEYAGIEDTLDMSTDTNILCEDERRKREEKQKREAHKWPFRICESNSYGGAIGKLKWDYRRGDDGKSREVPMSLSSGLYYLLEWASNAVSEVYDFDEVEAYEKDEKTFSTRKSNGVAGLGGESDSSDEQENVMTLHKCLKGFTKVEQLGKDDPWYCSSCKEHKQATKKFDLWRLPRILVVHLKRFSYNRIWRDKLSTSVDFPLKDLDLSEHVMGPDADKALYDLYAVSHHYGGLGGGHYTATCLNKETGKWYNFDDSSVSPTNADSARSSSSYVLFYCRKERS